MIAMRILPGKNPEIIDIRNRLHELQLAVEGYIEVIPCPWDRMARLVVNEEGKIRHMPPNRILNDPHTGMYDILAGPILIVGINKEDFDDLTDDQIQAVKDLSDEYLIMLTEAKGGRR